MNMRDIMHLVESQHPIVEREPEPADWSAGLRLKRLSRITKDGSKFETFRALGPNGNRIAEFTVQLVNAVEIKNVEDIDPSELNKIYDQLAAFFSPLHIIRPVE